MEYMVVPITIGETAVSIADLIRPLLPAVVNTQDVAQFTIFENSAPIKFGGASSQPATLAALSERTWPVRGCSVYVKRSGAVDSQALVECFINNSQD